MALYEHVYLARQDVTAQQVDAITEQLKGIIEANGGKNRKAHMSLFHIEAPSAAVTEMERQMRINEDIIRFLTLRVDAFEEGPSAMLRKREDGDRDDRDRGDRRPGGRFDRDRGDRPPRRPRDEAVQPAGEI